LESVKPYWTQYNQTARKSTADKRYKTQWWKNYSENLRRKFPLCAECLRKGIIRAATLVDHIIRVNFGGSFKDPRNHQTMCDCCHRDKSFAERNGLSIPYELNDAGEKIPFDKGGVSFWLLYTSDAAEEADSVDTCERPNVY